MKNNILFLVTSFLFSTSLLAQDEDVFPFFFRIIDANQQITYLATPFIYKCLENPRTLELTEAEGRKGFLVEPSINLDFPIVQGKVDGRPIWNTSRIYINFGFNTRVVKTKSSPILPPTNRIGLGLDKILFETISGNKWFPWSFDLGTDVLMPSLNENIQVIYLSVLAEHISNGQNGEIFICDPISNEPIRNNYKDGDFSTNFYRIKLTYSGLFKRRTLLLTGSLGLQIETGKHDGLLVFFEEQEGRYGKVRILSMFQLRLPPINNLHEIRLRIENQLILGNCGKYIAYSKNYLNGTSFYLEYNPLNLKTLGFLFHIYRGRDYLNIRYDDPIIIGHLGITFSIKKYRPLSVPVIYY
jgi:hypothetical protein